ncbi:hypothetical protein CLPUN_07220 [Clostridium puniceum]|uniref:Uncharacterized protein n=1 Tax=Clostridium puniceum TaxID=29367 RepID=A0A1S8TVU5_9CLOT|nr:DUF6179 domain-containing protein [Clostridium puniceum]OOM81860.1 hypothetical protein CLPUN_07220 [Clostridium puniceum]
MDKFIEKNNYIRLDQLNEQNFFKEILIKCHEKNLLETSFLEKLNYERLDILKTQLTYYTKDCSSSVMVEIAENILDCIDYTIGIYLKAFKDIDFLLRDLKQTKLFNIFINGQDLIKEKIFEGRKLLSEIQNNKLKVSNFSYNDTIDYGIPLFFKEYEYFYSAHETPGSIDYQLFATELNNIGIEYINDYLKILNLENNFCNNFNIDDINELLKGYDKHCDELLINIFELILINSLGSIICDKDVTILNISALDREQIKSKLSNLSFEELLAELFNYSKKCCLILNIKDSELIKYIKKSIIKIAPLIKESLALNKLETMFISFNLNNNHDGITSYIDGKKSSNTYFRHLIKKIMACPVSMDKVQLIKNNIHSLEDLIDILEADCLYGNEFYDLFKSLSQLEIALLLKNLPNLNFESDYKKEWHLKFSKYFSALSEEDKKVIRKLEEQIKLA